MEKSKSNKAASKSFCMTTSKSRATFFVEEKSKVIQGSDWQFRNHVKKNLKQLYTPNDWYNNNEGGIKDAKPFSQKYLDEFYQKRDLTSVPYEEQREKPKKINPMVIYNQQHTVNPNEFKNFLSSGKKILYPQSLNHQKGHGILKNYIERTKSEITFSKPQAIARQEKIERIFGSSGTKSVLNYP